MKTKIKNIDMKTKIKNVDMKTKIKNIDMKTKIKNIDMKTKIKNNWPKTDNMALFRGEGVFDFSRRQYFGKIYLSIGNSKQD